MRRGEGGEGDGTGVIAMGNIADSKPKKNRCLAKVLAI
jgi:hypothetical protein